MTLGANEVDENLAEIRQLDSRQQRLLLRELEELLARQEERH